MDLIDRQQAIDAMGAINDSICEQQAIDALCELPAVQTCEDAVSRQAVIDALEKVAGLYPWRVPGDRDSYSSYNEAWQDALNRVENEIEALPSVQPDPEEWNNHTVACLLAELFGDTCACNYNGIDEWLPEKCEVIDACPEPVGVACWEQFLKHRVERRTE